MDILRPLRGICVLTLFISCAKLSYLTEQGIGQVKILTNARENKEVLSDPKIKQIDKEKIQKISAYKKFFYEYWQKKPSNIYEKTTILNRDAVTYLVIASKPREIKAKKECFPFYGCFPYLGFFKKESAREHVKQLEESGHETYMRRVLAYSTLGTFNDPILSTFFLYDEYGLAETIFHELFHTILFIDDEVDLNENLANFFGKAMVYKYFNQSKKLDKYYQQEKKYAFLREEIVIQSKKLEEILSDEDWKSKKKRFVEVIFPESMKKKCDELAIDNCWPVKLKWNSATFSAFNTYEKSQNEIKAFSESFSGDLKDLFQFVTKKYDKYREDDIEDTGKSFEKYLLGK